MKRAFDFSVALVGLVITLPILAAAALLVWLWDFRNPIYVSLRVRDPRSTFPMYKFRSMVPGADLRGGASTPENDRRLTPIGRLIRACKVDELPQLWNVLIGDMSLVGPRAQVVKGAILYTAEENHLFDVRPGITDFASIVFADEGQILSQHDDPDEAYDRLIRPWKSRLGLTYARNHRLWIDAALIGLTLVAIVSKNLARRGVQMLLTRIHAPEALVRVAGRAEALEPTLPPGGLQPAANGPYIPLALSQRAPWIRDFEQLKRGPIVVIHLALVALSNIAAWLLRHDGRLTQTEWQTISTALPWLLLTRGITFAPFRLYQSLWRYTGIYDLQAIMGAVIISSLLFAGVGAFLFPGYSRSVLILDALVLTYLLGGVRMVRRMYSEFGTWAPGTRDVLIYGAGDVGARLARAMRADRSAGQRPIGFIDDDVAKAGLRIHSVPVLGGRTHLASILAKMRPKEVILATRNAGDALRQVTEIVDAWGIEVTFAPGLGAAMVDEPAHPARARTPQMGIEAPSESAAEPTPHVEPPPHASVCPRCAGWAHRSHARTAFERLRRGWSAKRLHRCHNCGWRGWLVPTEHASGSVPSEGRGMQPHDLSELDDDFSDASLGRDSR
jgi:lipopolysaccharide/colanic/teichoic acid biosynthesis glycosyltransferase